MMEYVRDELVHAEIFGEKIEKDFAGARTSAETNLNGLFGYPSRTSSALKTNHGNTQVPPTSVPQPSYQRDTSTFWTICHYCGVYFEYMKVYLNRNLICRNCHMPFLALEIATPFNYFKSSNPASLHRHQNSSNHAPTSKIFSKINQRNLGSGWDLRLDWPGSESQASNSVGNNTLVQQGSSVPVEEMGSPLNWGLDLKLWPVMAENESDSSGSVGNNFVVQGNQFFQANSSDSDSDKRDIRAFVSILRRG